MSEYLVNYRSELSGRYIEIHVCNVDNTSEAVLNANDCLNFIQDDVYEYYTHTDTQPVCMLDAF